MTYSLFTSPEEDIKLDHAPGIRFIKCSCASSRFNSCRKRSYCLFDVKRYSIRLLIVVQKGLLYNYRLNDKKSYAERTNITIFMVFACFSREREKLTNNVITFSCIFQTKAHLDVLADAILRWARGR